MGVAIDRVSPLCMLKLPQTEITRYNIDIHLVTVPI